MDFTLPEHIETLRLKTRDFVNQKIIPLESDISSYDKHENINEDLLSQIRLDVKDAVWVLTLPRLMSVTVTSDQRNFCLRRDLVQHVNKAAFVLELSLRARQK